MKKQQILSALAVFFFLFSISNAIGQERNNKVKTLPVNTQFQIDFSEVNQKKIAKEYTVDISALNFKSAQVLTKFCEMFSFDFQTLRGDFTTQTISIEIDQSMIQKRGYPSDFVENHFLDISARMLYMFNKLNI